MKSIVLLILILLLAILPVFVTLAFMVGISATGLLFKLVTRTNL